MMVTAWNNGDRHESGAGRGIKIEHREISGRRLHPYGLSVS